MPPRANDGRKRPSVCPGQAPTALRRARQTHLGRNRFPGCIFKFSRMNFIQATATCRRGHQTVGAHTRTRREWPEQRPLLKYVKRRPCLPSARMSKKKGDLCFSLFIYLYYSKIFKGYRLSFRYKMSESEGEKHGASRVVWGLSGSWSLSH